MPLGKQGYITYEEFEVWFKDVTHDDDPDVPVLPQYMVDKITDLAEGRSIAGAAKPDGLSKGRPFKVCQHT